MVGRWQERYLVHGEGDALGDPVRLRLYWWYILNRIYEFNPVTGQLAHDRVLIGMGKGNDKTEGCARLGNAELMGPIAPARSPRVVLSATSYEQTKELFNAAKLTIVGDPQHNRPGPLAHYFREGDHILEDRILLPEGVGVLERIAAVGGTTDGGKPTAHIGDELHELDTERKQRVYIVQGKSVRKRRVPRRTPPDLYRMGLTPGVNLWGALQIGITTTGPDKDSLLGRLYDYGVAVAKGEIHDPGFLFLWWEGDEALDLSDPEQLRQAILQANPAAGDFLPLENKIASYHDRTVPRVEFVRYDLNRWPEAETAWMPRADWDASIGDVTFDTDLPVYAVVNIAHDHRRGAVAVAQQQGERVALRVEHFVSADEDEYLDVTAIEDHLRSLFRSYPAAVMTAHEGVSKPIPGPGPEIVHHGAFFAGSEQRLRREGMSLVLIPSSAERFAPPAETLLKLVIGDHEEGRQLVHEDDPELARQMGHVVAKEAAKGWFVAARSGQRVPAAFASMLAVHRALNEKKAPPPEEPVYGSF